MKKEFTLVALLFVLPVSVFAVSPVASVSGTKKVTPTSVVANKIEDLKERLATKVAELRKTSPKAIYGTVTATSLTSLTIDTTQKAMKIELTDDIKVIQFLKGKRTTLTTEDVSKNDIVTVFGEYDETLDLLKATKIFIEAAKPVSRIHGTITEINKKNNSFTIKGIDESNYTIDVEVTTKNTFWTQEKGVEKSGFSKLAVGDFATAVGAQDPKNADLFIATRILSFKAPTQATLVPLTSPTASVAASPSATPKTTAKPSVTPTKAKASPTSKATPTP